MTLIALTVSYVKVRELFFVVNAVNRHLLNATSTGLRTPAGLGITPDSETEIGCPKTPPQCKMDGMSCR